MNVRTIHMQLYVLQVIEHITTIQILPSMRHFFYQGSKEEDLYMHMSTEIHKYRKYVRI